MLERLNELWREWASSYGHGERFGQYTWNRMSEMFDRESWPELFYEPNAARAYAMAYNRLDAITMEARDND